MKTHTITTFTHDGAYRGMACSCGFTAYTGVEADDRRIAEEHLRSHGQAEGMRTQESILESLGWKRGYDALEYDHWQGGQSRPIKRTSPANPKGWTGPNGERYDILPWIPELCPLIIQAEARCAALQAEIERLKEAIQLVRKADTGAWLLAGAKASLERGSMIRAIDKLYQASASQTTGSLNL